MRLLLSSLFLLQAGLMFSSPSSAESYELGQGLHVDKYFAAGYANIEAENPVGAPGQINLDDLSLFLGGNVSDLINPFAEIELSNQTLAQQGGNTDDGEVVVERFYNGMKLSEFDSFRVGKMLSPVGDWNMVHAAPLVPTITRPYTTALGFNAYTSGMQWLHDPKNSAAPQIDLYWQPGDEWFKRSINLTTRHFHNVIGGHINLPLGLIDKIGASFQSGQLVETGETYGLIGFNASKSIGKLSLQSEVITAHFSGAVLPGASPRIHNNESGIFGLADYSVTPHWHGILASEYYQDHMVNASSRSSLVAVAYKPSVPIVWKIEYLHQAGVSATIAPVVTGWKAALSVMF